MRKTLKCITTKISILLLAMIMAVSFAACEEEESETASPLPTETASPSPPETVSPSPPETASLLPTEMPSTEPSPSGTPVPAGATYVEFYDMYVDLTDTASLSRDIIGWSENQTRSQMLDKYNIVTGFEMDDQVIYLTFNLGYEHVRGNTEKLLEILSLRDIKATFFLVGEFIEVFPEKVQAIYEDGHTLGAHSYYHIPPSYTMTDEEYINDLISTEKLLQTALGDDYTRMKYYRPIAGEYCERDLYIATTLGYTTVLFDATYSDWNRTVVNGMDYALTELKADVHNGAVYQLHIVTSDNIEALPAFLDDLISQGYTFKAF